LPRRPPKPCAADALPFAQTKQALTVRDDAGIIAAFKASGDGWQTRMNDALREWLDTRPPTPSH
jgi:uncharacterized protein (DUF4415 family)